MAGSFGFGVPGALNIEAVAEIAAAVELAGFKTFWVNDTPGGDGLKALAAAANATKQIRLGVGVIPVDRKPATQIAKEIGQLALPVERLIVGVGSGSRGKGALDLVRQEVEILKQNAGVVVALGALGPRMVELGAEVADAVLLNWLTVQQAERSATEIRRIASGSNRRVEIIAYVRAGLPEAEQRIRTEADRYNSYPSYRRHFASMGVTPLETCVIAGNQHSANTLQAFAGHLDETVIRAVPVTETATAYLNLLDAVRDTTIG